MIKTDGSENIGKSIKAQQKEYFTEWTGQGKMIRPDDQIKLFLVWSVKQYEIPPQVPRQWIQQVVQKVTENNLILRIFVFLCFANSFA